MRLFLSSTLLSTVCSIKKFIGLEENITCKVTNCISFALTAKFSIYLPFSGLFMLALKKNCFFKSHKLKIFN